MPALVPEAEEIQLPFNNESVSTPPGKPRISVCGRARGSPPVRRDDLACDLLRRSIIRPRKARIVEAQTATIGVDFPPALVVACARYLLPVQQETSLVPMAIGPRNENQQREQGHRQGEHLEKHASHGCA